MRASEIGWRWGFEWRKEGDSWSVWERGRWEPVEWEEERPLPKREDGLGSTPVGGGGDQPHDVVSAKAEGPKPKFDRNAYQRELMRKRRAAKKDGKAK